MIRLKSYSLAAWPLQIRRVCKIFRTDGIADRKTLTLFKAHFRRMGLYHLINASAAFYLRMKIIFKNECCQINIAHVWLAVLASLSINQSNANRNRITGNGLIKVNGNPVVNFLVGSWYFLIKRFSSAHICVPVSFSGTFVCSGRTGTWIMADMAGASRI